MCVCVRAHVRARVMSGKGGSDDVYFLARQHILNNMGFFPQLGKVADPWLIASQGNT